MQYWEKKENMTNQLIYAPHVCADSATCVARHLPIHFGGL